MSVEIQGNSNTKLEAGQPNLNRLVTKDVMLAVSYDDFIRHAEERTAFRRKADEDFVLARKEYLASKQ